jgi:DNA-binding LacI/PurR family transcriptional regulator
VPPDHIETMYSDRDPVAAFTAISPVLRELRRPLAIGTGLDSGGIGVPWACLRAGIEVPRDVAIVGFGDTLEAGITCPPLSTMGTEMPEVGRAADLIVARIEQPTLPGRHIADPWTFIPP